MGNYGSTIETGTNMTTPTTTEFDMNEYANFVESQGLGESPGFV